VKTVQEVESAIRVWSRSELEKLRERIDEILEDERELTDEFQASIERGIRDIAEGRVRVR
jgi:hypothetical protein